MPVQRFQELGWSDDFGTFGHFLSATEIQFLSGRS
jgi:hypothetical protein